MKKFALLPVFALLALVMNSCCSSNSVSLSGSGCNARYTEKEVVEWEDYEVLVDNGAKGGGMTTVTERRQVVKTVRVKVDCPKCTSYWKECEGCCDTVGQGVYSRVTAQGGTGEPHIGLIPTMRVLAE